MSERKANIERVHMLLEDFERLGPDMPDDKLVLLSHELSTLQQMVLGTIDKSDDMPLQVNDYVSIKASANSPAYLVMRLIPTSLGEVEYMLHVNGENRTYKRSELHRVRLV